MMLLLCACGNLETGKNQGEVAENDKIQIGMSFDSFVIERWQRDRDIFVSTAKELGAEVNVQNANGDLEQQKKQINYFIQTVLSASEFHRIMPYGSWAVPPVGNRTLP